MKRLLTVAVMLCTGTAIHAQTLDDISRYALWQPLGSARALGMGGAVSTVGADISNMSVNPAGLGMFRQNHVATTVGLVGGNSGSTYLGTNGKGYKSSAQLPQLGVVFANEYPREKNKGLLFANFGFGFNQVNDFNRGIFLSGTNHSSSYLDRLAEYATMYGLPNDLSDDNLGVTEEAAFMANTIVAAGGNTYEANLPADAIVKQSTNLRSGGRMNDWNATGSLNFSNTFYIGVSLGLTSVRYRNTTTIAEETVNTDFAKRSFENQYSYNVRGSGVNLKSGVLLKVTDWMRLSAAVHTATTYNLKENYTETFVSSGFPETNYIGAEGYKLVVGPFVSDYNIASPARYLFGVGLNYEKIAFLAIDYEVINYSKSSIQGFEGSNSLNSAIPFYFNSQGQNIKVGLEYNYYDMRFRAGYNSLSSVYLEANGSENRSNIFTLGLGYYSQDGWYINGGILFGKAKTNYTPYVLEQTNREFYTAKNTLNTTNFLISIGTTFE